MSRKLRSIKEAREAGCKKKRGGGQPVLIGKKNDSKRGRPVERNKEARGETFRGKRVQAEYFGSKGNLESCARKTKIGRAKQRVN